MMFLGHLSLVIGSVLWAFHVIFKAHVGGSCSSQDWSFLTLLTALYTRALFDVDWD